MTDKKLVLVRATPNDGRYLRQVGFDKAIWTGNKELATKFDLNKLDKVAVSHIEKHVGKSVILIPV